MSQDANQWVMPLGDYHGIRHSKLNQITADNAAKLTVAWTMSTGTLRGQEGQPLVIGNMMYFESSYPNFIYAVDLNNIGRIAWKFAPEQDKFAPSVACCDVVNRGVAYADGKIIATTLDTTCLRPRRQDRPGGLEGAERRPRAGANHDHGAAGGA